MAIYTFELAALFAAKRWQVLREGAILFDIFTVLCGFAATIVRTMNLPETRKKRRERWATLRRVSRDY